MTRPIEAITNAQTGETIYQEMSDESYAIYLADIEADKIATQAKAEAEAQTATDKAALLAKLGITADEAKLLLS
jgi:hypothetical protein